MPFSNWAVHNITVDGALQWWPKCIWADWAEWSQLLLNEWVRKHSWENKNPKSINTKSPPRHTESSFRGWEIQFSPAWTFGRSWSNICQRFLLAVVQPGSNRCLSWSMSGRSIKTSKHASHLWLAGEKPDEWTKLFGNISRWTNTLNTSMYPINLK